MSNLHLSARSHPLKEYLWVIKQCFKTGDSSVSSSSFFSYLPILYICYFFLILMAGWGVGKLLCPVSCMLLFLWFVGDGPNVWFLHLSLSESAFSVVFCCLLFADFLHTCSGQAPIHLYFPLLLIDSYVDFLNLHAINLAFDFHVSYCWFFFFIYLVCVGIR